MLESGLPLYTQPAFRSELSADYNNNNNLIQVDHHMNIQNDSSYGPHRIDFNNYTFPPNTQNALVNNSLYSQPGNQPNVYSPTSKSHRNTKVSDQFVHSQNALSSQAFSNSLVPPSLYQVQEVAQQTQGKFERDQDTFAAESSFSTSHVNHFKQKDLSQNFSFSYEEPNELEQIEELDYTSTEISSSHNSNHSKAASASLKTAPVSTTTATVKSRPYDKEMENGVFGPVNPHSVNVSAEVMERMRATIAEITGEEPEVLPIETPLDDKNSSQKVFFTFQTSDNLKSAEKDKPPISNDSKEPSPHDIMNFKKFKKKRNSSRFKRKSVQKHVKRASSVPIHRSPSPKTKVFEEGQPNKRYSQTLSKQGRVDKNQAVATNSKLFDYEEKRKTVSSALFVAILTKQNEEAAQQQNTSKNLVSSSSRPASSICESIGNEVVPTSRRQSEKRISILTSGSLTSRERAKRYSQCHSSSNSTRNPSIASRATSGRKNSESLKVHRASKTMQEINPVTVIEDIRKACKDLLISMIFVYSLVKANCSSNEAKATDLAIPYINGLNIVLGMMNERQEKQERGQNSTNETYGPGYVKKAYAQAVEDMVRFFCLFNNVVTAIFKHNTLRVIIEYPVFSTGMNRLKVTQHQLKDLNVPVSPPYDAEKVAIHNSIDPNNEICQPGNSRFEFLVERKRLRHSWKPDPTYRGPRCSEADASKPSQNFRYGNANSKRYSTLSKTSINPRHTGEGFMDKYVPSESTLELNQLQYDLANLTRGISTTSKNKGNSMQVQRMSIVSSEQDDRMTQVKMLSKYDDSDDVRNTWALLSGDFSNASGLRPVNPQQLSQQGQQRQRQQMQIPPHKNSVVSNFTIDNISEELSEISDDDVLNAKLKALNLAKSSTSEIQNRESVKSYYRNSLRSDRPFLNDNFNQMSKPIQLSSYSDTPFNAFDQKVRAPPNATLPTPPTTNDRSSNSKDERVRQGQENLNARNKFQLNFVSNEVPAQLPISFITPEPSPKTQGQFSNKMNQQYIANQLNDMSISIPNQSMIENPVYQQPLVVSSYPYFFNLNDQQNSQMYVPANIGTQQTKNTSPFNLSDQKSYNVFSRQYDTSAIAESKPQLKVEKGWKKLIPQNGFSKLQIHKSDKFSLAEPDANNQSNSILTKSSRVFKKRFAVSKAVNGTNCQPNKKVKRTYSHAIFHSVENKYQERRILGVGRYSEVYKLKNVVTNEYFAGKSIPKETLIKRLWLVRNEFAVLRRITSNLYPPFRESVGITAVVKTQYDKFRKSVGISSNKSERADNFQTEYQHSKTYFDASRIKEEVESPMFIHPNLTHLVDMFGSATNIYFVSPLAKGPTLKEYLGHYGPMNEEETKYVMKQLTSAVVFMHDRGIAHRNLTLENIVLKKSIKKTTLTNPLLPYAQPDLQASRFNENDFEIMVVDMTLARLLDKQTDYYYAELLNIQLNNTGKLDPTPTTFTKMVDLRNDRHFYKFWIGGFGDVEYMPPEMFEACEGCGVTNIRRLVCERCTHSFGKFSAERRKRRRRGKSGSQEEFVLPNQAENGEHVVTMEGLFDRSKDLLINSLNILGAGIKDNSDEDQYNSRANRYGKYRIDDVVSEDIDDTVYGSGPDPRLRDVWAMGVIMYALLCNRFPFGNGEPIPQDKKQKSTLENRQTENVRIYKRIVNKEYTHEPEQIWNGISDCAKSFLEWCLNKDINDRIWPKECMKHPFLKQEVKQDH